MTATLTGFQQELCDTSPSDFSDLRALFVNCTLKPSPQLSHTQGLMDISMTIMESNDVAVENIRAIDYDIPVSVYQDMTGHGFDTDEWPALYEKVQAADILVLGTSIWLGEKTSVCTKIIERLYDNSSLLNDAGGFPAHGNQRWLWEAGCRFDFVNPDYR